MTVPKVQVARGMGRGLGERLRAPGNRHAPKKGFRDGRWFLEGLPSGNAKQDHHQPARTGTVFSGTVFSGTAFSGMAVHRSGLPG